MRGREAGVHGNTRVGVHVYTVLIYGAEFFLRSQVAGSMHIRTCIVCVLLHVCISTYKVCMFMHLLAQGMGSQWVSSKLRCGLMLIPRLH